jgi:OmpR-family two-component system manganese-sensing sensor histidine kinase
LLMGRKTDMFKKLKRRLIFLYGVTSSIILTSIIIGISILNYQQNKEQDRELFQNKAEQIVEKIRADNIINNAWMLQMEKENNYIILVEENKKQLTAYNHKDKKAEIDKIVVKLKEQAAAEGVNTERKPLYSKVEKTPVLPLDIGTRESYLGIATVLPKNNGWITIMVISGNEQRMDAQLSQILLFMLIDLVGVAALFLISRLYIGRIIRPLEEGQEKQNAFIAAASHELRSPLTVIKTGVASIRDDITKAEQFLPHVEGECNRMARLINDMLLLAAADSKTWKLKQESMDMDTLLIECYDMVCTCLNEKQIDIKLELPEERLSPVKGDKERMKQILMILMDNAMSHSLEGGCIVIRAFNNKRNVIIEVEDHGKGISEEDKKRVFERFYRGDQSRNEKKHFGLGLSIAKELTELHQGEIQVRDTPGGGATFIVRLPC